MTLGVSATAPARSHWTIAAAPRGSSRPTWGLRRPPLIARHAGLRSVPVGGKRRRRLLGLGLGPPPQTAPREAKTASSTSPTGWHARHGRQLHPGACFPFRHLAGPIIGLIASEPDLGTTGVITLAAFTMFFVAGGSVLQWAVLGAAGCRDVYRLRAHEPLSAGTLDHVPRSLVAADAGGLPHGAGAVRVRHGRRLVTGPARAWGPGGGRCP